MKRIWFLATLTAALLWSVGVASGQTGKAPEQPGTAPEQTPVKPATPVAPEMQPSLPVTTPTQSNASAKADVSAEVAVIVEKAKKAPAKEAEDTDRKIGESVKLVEKEAATKSEQVMASRLAPEFGVTAEALIAEKGKYQAGWGELMIAHTVFANAKGAATMDQIFEMRRAGLGWGQMAHGLDLKMSGVASAVKAESRVATGAVKADGRPEKIQSATVKTSTGTKAGVGAGNTGAGVASDVGVGATVKTQTGK